MPVVWWDFVVVHGSTTTDTVKDSKPSGGGSSKSLEM